MRCPAGLAALPFLTGAALAVVLSGRLEPDAPVVLASAAALAWLAAAGSLLLDDRWSCAAAAGFGCLLTGLSLGATAVRRADAPPLLSWFLARPPGEVVVIEGTLREDAAPAGGGVLLSLDVHGAGGHVFPRGGAGGVRLVVGGTAVETGLPHWTAGRRLRMPAVLRLPATYLNPGVRDERRALARRGIALVGSVKSAYLVEVVRPAGLPGEAAAAVRAWTRRRVAAHVGARDARAAGVTAAVLIGDRSGLSRDDERRLQEAGTYHVIAISGGNIAILALLLLGLCRLVLVPPRSASIVTAAALVFYGSIAAGAASVTRAVTVAVLVLAARALDHRGAALNVLASTALLVVAVSPLGVADAGFILSFGATAGILVGVPRLLGQRAGDGQRAGRSMVSRLALAAAALLAATVSAEAALAPVGASLFARVPLAGLLLNFAAIPLMTCVQVAGLAVVLASDWWDAAARAGAAAAHLAAAGLLESSRLVDAAPWLSLDVRPPAWWVIALYYTGVAGLLHVRTRRVAAASLAGAVALMLSGANLAAHDAFPQAARHPLRVVMLDVGQGDATVIAIGGRSTLLVDAGGLTTGEASGAEGPPGFDVGDRVVAPALRALGVRRLDALVLTHGDPDHIVGVPGLLRRIPASSLWEGVPVPPHPGLRALAALADGQRIPWRSVQAGDAERHGPVEIRVLHPPLPDWERQRVRNDDSIVLELRLGQVSVVLPGDIGREGEQALRPRLAPGRLVVLKAPHHGSASSSTAELVEALRPAAVIFSCGRGNRFGHPHPDVVARYRAIGAKIFSTAEDGAVFVETDGRRVEVWGWRGRRVRLP